MCSRRGFSLWFFDTLLGGFLLLFLIEVLGTRSCEHSSTWQWYSPASLSVSLAEQSKFTSAQPWLVSRMILRAHYNWTQKRLFPVLNPELNEWTEMKLMSEKLCLQFLLEFPLGFPVWWLSTSWHKSFPQVRLRRKYEKKRETLETENWTVSPWSVQNTAWHKTAACRDLLKWNPIY